MNVWDAIKSKRAVRVFTDEPLPEDTINRILEAGRRAQSSKNSQPWHFIAVRKRETLQALAETGTFMGHVAGATLAIAIVVPPDPRGWVIAFDAGQAAAYMQLAAQELGVGSCLGAVYEPEKVNAILGIPEGMKVDIVISFGYPAPEQPRPGVKPGRNPLTEIVHFDQW